MSRKILQPEHEQFIRLHCKGISNKELARKLSEHFEKNFAECVVIRFKHQNGLKSGYYGTSPISSRFQKGHVPANKGKVGCYAPGSEKGWFQKGHRPQTSLPVGTEIQRGDGYIWIKIAEPKKWKEKHRIIWEQEHGQIPLRHMITFLDGNKRNFAIENLSLITKEENAVLNKMGLRHTELEGAGYTLAKLIAKTRKTLKEQSK